MQIRVADSQSRDGSADQPAIRPLLCLAIRASNHDFDVQSLEGVTLPRTVAVRGAH